MKNIDDLISSVTSIHARYNAGRIERETVREWVLGLGGYPQPYGAAIQQAADWYRPVSSDLPPDEIKVRDLDCLKSIIDAHSLHATSRDGAKHLVRKG